MTAKVGPDVCPVLQFCLNRTNAGIEPHQECEDVDREPTQGEQEYNHRH